MTHPSHPSLIPVYPSLLTSPVYERCVPPPPPDPPPSPILYPFFPSLPPSVSYSLPILPISPPLPSPLSCPSGLHHLSPTSLLHPSFPPFSFHRLNHIFPSRPSPLHPSLFQTHLSYPQMFILKNRVREPTYEIAAFI